MASVSLQLGHCPPGVDSDLKPTSDGNISVQLTLAILQFSAPTMKVTPPFGMLLDTHLIVDLGAGSSRLHPPVEGQLEGHLDECIRAAFLLLNKCFPIVVKLINNEIQILYYSVKEKEDILHVRWATSTTEPTQAF